MPAKETEDLGKGAFGVSAGEVEKKKEGKKTGRPLHVFKTPPWPTTKRRPSCQGAAVVS